MFVSTPLTAPPLRVHKATSQAHIYVGGERPSRWVTFYYNPNVIIPPPALASESLLADDVIPSHFAGVGNHGDERRQGNEKNSDHEVDGTSHNPLDKEPHVFVF